MSVARDVRSGEHLRVRLVVDASPVAVVDPEWEGQGRTPREGRRGPDMDHGSLFCGLGPVLGEFPSQ